MATKKYDRAAKVFAYHFCQPLTGKGIGKLMGVADQEATNSGIWIFLVWISTLGAGPPTRPVIFMLLETQSLIMQPHIRIYLKLSSLFSVEDTTA